jgi:hypothetical protein
MVTKADLHEMVDELRDNEVDAAAHLLTRLREDPMLAVHAAASDDDEPLTDEEVADIEEGLRDLAAGRKVSLDELERELEG